MNEEVTGINFEEWRNCKLFKCVVKNPSLWKKHYYETALEVCRSDEKYSLSCIFAWADTPQRFNFWNKICYGDHPFTLEAYLFVCVYIDLMDGKTFDEAIANRVPCIEDCLWV